MIKSLWNEKKKKLNQEFKNIKFHEGEIWWISIGINIGTEVYGKGEHFRRPVIVFKKISKIDCIVIPLSAGCKKGSWYFSFTLNEVERTALLHQIRLVSSKRFESRIETLKEGDIEILKKAVSDFLLPSLTSSSSLEESVGNPKT